MTHEPSIQITEESNYADGTQWNTVGEFVGDYMRYRYVNAYEYDTLEDFVASALDLPVKRVRIAPWLKDVGIHLARLAQD